MQGIFFGRSESCGPPVQVLSQGLCHRRQGVPTKTDKVFAHYANHIKKESALETIVKTLERFFAPIFEELSITDIEYSICDEAAEKQNLGIIES